MSPSPTDKKQRGKAVSPHWKKGVQQGSAGDRKRKAESEERGHGGSRCRDPRAVSDVVGGRTFPGELSHYIIAGYENPRVFPSVPSTKADGQAKGKRKVFVPSGGQTAAVLSKCLPRHVSAFFTERILHYQKASVTASMSVGDGVPIGAKICKTTLLQAFTSRSWIHSELVMFLWSGVNTCVATTTRRQEVWLSLTFLNFLFSTRCWHGPEHIRSRCVT